MQEQEGTQKIFFFFIIISCDKDEEPDQKYKVNYWIKQEDVHTGVTFKSEK